MKNPSTLQKLSVATFKELMSIIPLNIMTDVSEYLRLAVQNALTTTTGGHFDVFQVSENIQAIGFDLEEHVVKNKDLSSCRILVYIHGGGFIVRDCSDLMIAERLLPLIKEHPDMPNNVVIVSLLYPLARDGRNNADVILRFLLESMDILQRRYDGQIDGIIGDSAGGYLALQVAERLTSKVVPKLSLMSPWLNLYSNADSYIRNKNYDFLDIRFIERARNMYLNVNPSNENISSSNQDSSDMSHEELLKLAKEIVERLKVMGIKVVAFDMDQCLVNAHSRGDIKRQPGELQKFYDKVTIGFKVLSRVLHKEGIKLAIATHSDENEYFTLMKSQQDYVIGTELVSLVLSSSVPELSHRFYIVAYNPMSRLNFNPNDAHKKLHIRRVAQHYNVKTSEIVLFDDDEGNVRDTNGEFIAIKVHPEKGLELEPILHHLKKSDAGTDSNKSGSKDKIDNSRFFDPSALSNDRLAKLPTSENVQIIIGTEEMFYDDCKNFESKLNQLYKYSNDTSIVDLVVADDWHVYPIFWMSIARRAIITLFLAPLLFILQCFADSLLGKGAIWHKGSKSSGGEHKDDRYSENATAVSTVRRFSNSQTVDSELADVAIKRIASFFYSNRN